MSPTTHTKAPHPTALRVFRALALLLAVTVVIQVALAGLGVFGAVGWDWHRRFAVAVESVPLLLLLVALVGRLRGGLRWLPLLTLGLVAIQHLTATVGGAAGAVHAVNAFATFGIAMRMHGLATSSLGASDPSPTPRRRGAPEGVTVSVDR